MSDVSFVVTAKGKKRHIAYNGETACQMFYPGHTQFRDVTEQDMNLPVCEQCKRSVIGRSLEQSGVEF